MNYPDNIEMAADLAIYALYQQGSLAMKETFDSMPAIRQVRTMALFKVSLQVAQSVWAFSRDYSGKTERFLRWTSDPRKVGVTTENWTSRTDFYPHPINNTKRPKWDGKHTLTLCPEGLIEIALRPDIAKASEKDGLPLLSLSKDGYGVWAKFGGGKKLTSEYGWVAFTQGYVGHNTISMELAQKTLRMRVDGRFLYKTRSLNGRKPAKAKSGRPLNAYAIAGRFIRRYPETIIRLVDARRLGYCVPGILQFQKRYEVGDNVPARRLLDTGNSKAQALVFGTIARTIRGRRQRGEKCHHRVELYNRRRDGSELRKIPDSWQLIPEGHPIPRRYIECREDYSTGSLRWSHVVCCSPMTPMWAEVTGGVRAFARKIKNDKR